MKPIPWNEFRVLLNIKGDGLQSDLLECINQYADIEEFIVRKGGFLDIFIKVFTGVSVEDIAKMRDEINKKFPTIGNRVIFRYKY